MKNHEFKICRGKGLCLVCRGSHGSTDLAGGYLDGDPRQQLVKQANTRWPRALLGSLLVLLDLQCMFFLNGAINRHPHTNSIDTL